jgi:hypothetical protein
MMDAWVSEWALGYPVWRVYQPLPHAAAAVALKVCRPLADPATIFATMYYLLLIAFPFSVYVGARFLGLPPPESGLAALLAFAASEPGEFGKYGLGYGALVWRGSGLYTQLFALHLMVIAIGVTARALDRGRRESRAVAAALLALTALSHLVFGYAAFLSAAVLAFAGPVGERGRRLVRLGTIVLPALLLLAWFFVPMALAHETLNQSRWEPSWKWDSFGAPQILRELFSGRLLDSGRLPLLSILAAAGAAGAVVFRHDARSRRLLALAAVWLVVFFGRETWGHLMDLAALPPSAPVHRFESVFEWSALLLAVYGLGCWMRSAVQSGHRGVVVCVVIATGLSSVYLLSDRAAYLKQNRAWGEENLHSIKREQPDLEAALADVRALLAARPGRVSSGTAATWGARFKVGRTPVFALLSRRHFDQTSFLYHSMSRPSDLIFERPLDPVHDVLFGIRAVIAPTGEPAPPHLRLRSAHGRFSVYESSSAGYFGVVDIAGHAVEPYSADKLISSAWLASSLPSFGRVLSLDSRLTVGPGVAKWAPMPEPGREPPLTGEVLQENKAGETYRAKIFASRDAYALVKMTWHPDLAATVDGRPAPVLHVTPGFAAVPIPGGAHDVTVEYQPGPLKPLLLGLGLIAFVVACRWLGQGRGLAWETAAAGLAARAGAALAQPRFAAAGAIVLAAAVALHPMLRGKLVGGHDATEYPPRMVQMERALEGGHFPPVWAPDLGNGHGQPLFELAPPLVYWTALPFRGLGFGLTDSLQFGLALLHLLGAAAVYRIGRQLSFARHVATGSAILWLFGPYVCLDLYVRGAFAESASLAASPIALCALLRAMWRPSVARAAAAACAIALLLLGHVAAWLFVGCLVAVLAGVGWSVRRKSGVPLLFGLAALAGGMALTAFFWVPFFTAIPNVHMERLSTSPFNWSFHIIEPIQLLWSAWGYGVSVAGPNDGMSFSLGPAHLALAIAGLVILMRGRNDSPYRAIGVACAATALGGALLATNWTNVIWANVHILQYFYPWRALLLPAVTLPILAMFALARMPSRWAYAAVAAAVLVNLAHTEPREYLTFDDEYYAPHSIAARGLNTTTYEEYEPRWVTARPPFYPEAYRGLNAPIGVRVISNSAARHEHVLNASSPSVVESAVFYYPGWSLTIDGQPTKIQPVQSRGTIQFLLPPGEHRVKLELGATLARRLGRAISVAALALFACAIVVERRRRRKDQAKAASTGTL